MTKDEKEIWIAVFAARHESYAMETHKCREDCIDFAVEEADNTILALRRAANRRDGHVHRAYKIMEEEKLGRGIDVVQLPIDGSKG